MQTGDRSTTMDANVASTRSPPPRSCPNGLGVNTTKCRVSSDTAAQGCPFSIGSLAWAETAKHADRPLANETLIPEIPPLSRKQEEIIKSTAAILSEEGVVITTRFYKDMISAHSELRDVFSESGQKLGHQPAALAAAVCAYAENIQDLSPLLPVVDRIAQKHASLGITADQYGIVGKHLLQAIADVLGDAVTPELGDAWYIGYWRLAKIFIGREKELYATTEISGGWLGWRKFMVNKRVKESENVTSFYLKPAEGDNKLPEYQPGQYTAVSCILDESGRRQARQYSLSDCSNGREFRISVKREDDPRGDRRSSVGVEEDKESQAGLVSNHLHDSVFEGDTLDVASPYGDFAFEDSSTSQTAPVILLSAGVGQTALLSILNSLLPLETTSTMDSPSRAIAYIHVARNERVHAFAAHLRELAHRHRNLRYHVFYTAPSDAILGQDYDFDGRMDLAKVKDDLHISDPTAEYYLCGPERFMLDKQADLKRLGVEGKRIHCELFGTSHIS